MGTSASFTRHERAGVVSWLATRELDDGMCVAFTERGGGFSQGTHRSLNLASHVGDDPDAVDANRAALLGSLGIGDLRERLTMAEQVHGDGVARVGDRDSGHGAFAATGAAPLGATDALFTTERRIPLLMCFADCVPIVIVAPGCGVGVVHAGWRGALAEIPGKAVYALCKETACDPAAVRAYVGPHICARHYEVDETTMSHFGNHFGTVARAESGGLDLGAVVAVSLTKAGVDPCNIARLGTCTAETTDRFFSFRAEAGHTGRHGALACVL